ncbi:hypothetical protein J6590_067855 [Homalodisca vitripennis]|nr:hypothetical protein J6590_067855 [Homalodisca vitripennis]
MPWPLDQPTCGKFRYSVSQTNSSFRLLAAPHLKEFFSFGRSQPLGLLGFSSTGSDTNRTYRIFRPPDLRQILASSTIRSLEAPGFSILRKLSDSRIFRPLAAPVLNRADTESSNSKTLEAFTLINRNTSIAFAYIKLFWSLRLRSLTSKPVVDSWS